MVCNYCKTEQKHGLFRATCCDKAIIEELIEAHKSGDTPRYNRIVIKAEIAIGKRKEITVIRCDDINDMGDPPPTGRSGPIVPRPRHKVNHENQA